MTKKESKPLRYDARKGWVGGRPDTLYTFTDKLTGATRISDVPTTAVGPNCTWREATPQEADTFPGRGWRNQTKANAPKKDANRFFRITNTSSGVELGTYRGRNKDDALDALARDAGYRDREHAREVADDTDLEVVEVIVNKPKSAKKNAPTFTVVVVGRGDPLASFAAKTRDDALEAAMPDDGDPIAVYEGVVAPDAASARLPAYYRKVKPVRGRYEYSGDE